MKSFRLIAMIGAVVLALPAASRLDAQVRPGAAGDSAGPRRAVLEQRFREQSAELVRRRLQLSEDQMTKLKAANLQLERQRVALMSEERQARMALRSELMSADAANQQKVAGLLDQLMRLQRQRLDLVEGEQRELAKFLTPVQRAKYLGLQNQLRQRMQELRDRVGPGAMRGRPPMGRPGIRRNLR